MLTKASWWLLPDSVLRTFLSLLGKNMLAHSCLCGCGTEL